MNIEQLRAIRDRVAKLTGECWETSNLVLDTVLGRHNYLYGDYSTREWKGVGTNVELHVTKSIDAVEVLRQHVLPGSWVLVSLKDDIECDLCPPNQDILVNAASPTEPLARLLALLEALIAQMEAS